MKTETFSPQNDRTTKLNVKFLLAATVPVHVMPDEHAKTLRGTVVGCFGCVSCYSVHGCHAYLCII